MEDSTSKVSNQKVVKLMEPQKIDPNMSTQEKVDKYYWPLFGKNPFQTMPTIKFWQKDRQQIYKDYIIDIQGRLQRVGLKSKETKVYFYYLKGSYLCYKEKPGDKNIKGYLKLGPHITILKGSFTGKTEQVYYIELLKNCELKRKLYSKDSSLINDWFNFLRKYCVLQNYSEEYEQLEKLGAGSFSTQMMRNEYAVLKRMEHPNIIKVHEIFQEKEEIIYVMDHVEHGEIYQTLKKIKQFKEQDCAFIIKQLADALHLLHIENIVHRDLKLENIMISSPDKYEIKLIDFGFAEKINRSKLVSRAGTPGFLPPELFKLHPYTEKGDIFSLGIILYCMLVGTTPFKGETYKNVLENNKNCTINFEHENIKKISEECLHCLKGMLQSSPEPRYSAQDILDSRWIQKYYPDSNEVDSEVSVSAQELKEDYLTGKSSIFMKSNNETNWNDDDEEQTEGSSFVGSTFNHMYSEGMKTLYRKSMRSMSQQSKMSKIQTKFSCKSSGKTSAKNSQVPSQMSGFSSNSSQEDKNNANTASLAQNYNTLEKNVAETKFIKNITHSQSMGSSFKENSVFSKKTLQSVKDRSLGNNSCKSQQPKKVEMIQQNSSKFGSSSQFNMEDYDESSNKISCKITQLRNPIPRFVHHIQSQQFKEI